MPLSLTMPTDRTHDAVDLRVALRGSDGSWDWDWEGYGSELGYRLRVDAVELGVNDACPLARVSVNTGGEAYSGEYAMEPLEMSELPELVDPGQRCVIYAMRTGTKTLTGGAGRSFVFEGYLSTPQVSFSESELRCELIATSLLKRLDASLTSWIAGRRMYDAGTATIKHVEALPSVFNFRGRPNRHPDLHTYDGNDNVPLFTYDGDPSTI